MQAVCRLEDISSESGQEVCIDTDHGIIWLMLFMCQGEVLAYHNSCPHQGRALNFAPGRFTVTGDGKLVCPHHGATFELSNGLCISGPCEGSSLKRVTTYIVDGEVRVQISGV